MIAGHEGPRLRTTAIDLYKGLLIVAIILSHAIGLFSDGTLPWLQDVKRYIEVIAFPGFLLCFGYSTQLAYFSTRPLPIKRLAKTIARLIIAFCISAISFDLLVNTPPLNWEGLGQILTLSRIPPVSEFLLNFPLTLLMAALLIVPIDWVLKDIRRLLLVSGFLLGMALISTDRVSSPHVGLLIGAPRAVFSSFPVVQYFPFFLIGMYCARHKVQHSRLVLFGSLLGAAVFLISTQIAGWPVRFPPSLAWLVGSLAFALSGYFLVHDIPARSWFSRLVTPIGINSLNYFLLSNILLFALKGNFRTVTGGAAFCLAISLAVISVIYFIMANTRSKPQSMAISLTTGTAVPASALSPEQAELLQQLNNGQVLKVHRDLAGRKDFVLISPAGTSSSVSRELVEALVQQRLIDSNKKFPAATYWLTDRGRSLLGLS